MKFIYDIPDSFWSLFRSVNRDLYMEALLKISEEYEYNNYFLSKEVCVQVLSDWNVRKRIWTEQEEYETELDLLETPANRILNWLIRTQWLKKLDDFSTMTTNIVIPDYAAVFIEAFEHLTNPRLEDTQVYIQNVYATLFSFKHDTRANVSMLKTALVNTRKLNKALQDMLHNMDKFFGRLLEQQFYGNILQEHLDSYVEEVVKKKYHMLKTNDNFYIYKMDIKKCLREMREDEQWLERVRAKSQAEGGRDEDVLDMIDAIERGFDDIEHRIANMDREHSKYIRATVTRLNYMLSGEADMRGLIVQLLNHLSISTEGTAGAGQEERLDQIADCVNLSMFEILSEKSLYKRRRRRDFLSKMEPQPPAEELSKDAVLKLNKIQARYSKQEIEDFIEERMRGDYMRAGELSIDDNETFEKLILAYDYSTRKESRYKVLEGEQEQIENGMYRYPNLVFVRRTP